MNKRTHHDEYIDNDMGTSQMLASPNTPMQFNPPLPKLNRPRKKSNPGPQPTGFSLLTPDLLSSNPSLMLDPNSPWSPNINGGPLLSQHMVDSLTCSTANLSMRARGASMSNLSSPMVGFHSLQGNQIDLTNALAQQQPLSHFTNNHQQQQFGNLHHRYFTGFGTPETPMAEANAMHTPNSMASPLMHDLYYSLNNQMNAGYNNEGSNSNQVVHDSSNTPTPGSSLNNHDHLSITIPKRRPRATPEQLKLLEETFLQCTSPNAQLRAELAARLSMTERSVQIWFQNKRAKTKHAQRKSQLEVQESPSSRSRLGRSPSLSNINNDDWSGSSASNNNIMSSYSLGTVTPLTDSNSVEVAGLVDLMESYLFTVDSLIIGTWRRAAQYSSRSLFCAFSLIQRQFTWTITDNGHTFKMEIGFDQIQQLVLQRVPLPPPPTPPSVPASPTTEGMALQAVAIAAVNNPPQAELLLTISESPKFWMYVETPSGKLWTPCNDFTENRQAERCLQHKLRGVSDQLRVQVLGLLQSDAALRECSFVEDPQWNHRLVPASQCMLNAYMVTPSSADNPSAGFGEEGSPRDSACPLPQHLSLLTNRPRRSASAPMPPSFRLRQPLNDLAITTSPLSGLSPFFPINHPNGMHSSAILEDATSPFNFDSALDPTTQGSMGRLSFGSGFNSVEGKHTPMVNAFHSSPATACALPMPMNDPNVMSSTPQVAPNPGEYGDSQPAPGGETLFAKMFGSPAMHLESTSPMGGTCDLPNAYPSSVTSIMSPMVTNASLCFAKAVEADDGQHQSQHSGFMYHQQQAVVTNDQPQPSGEPIVNSGSNVADLDSFMSSLINV